MKFSIITPCLNSAATIEDTIKSVLNQKYADLEYIIVDGGSTDATLDVIKKYQSRIAKVISEPDLGIYDAMNKGIKSATGEIIGIINSDDFYIGEDIFNLVDSALQKSGANAVYGDLIYVDKCDTSKVVRRWLAGKFSPNKLRCGWSPPHPTCFIKRSVYDKNGLFNPTLPLAADYELLLRFFKQGVTFDYLPVTIAAMREGGSSAKNFSQRLRGWAQIRRAWKLNNLKPPFLLIPFRLISKVKQYFVCRPF